MTDFSCAFVSDILLQGYLYITKNYYAFYSNVFGYITRVLIPIKSVVKVSKEKTVKIIPNAIAVATADERHVFSSFLSRESAYQLMLSMWQDLIAPRDVDIGTSSACLRPLTVSVDNSTVVAESQAADKTSPQPDASVKHTLKVVNHKRQSSSGGGSATGDLNISELEDDSSSAVSGTEGFRFLRQAPNTVVDANSIRNEASEHNSDITTHESNSERESKDSQVVDVAEEIMPKPLTISFYQYQIPRTIHIAYFGLSLAVILALIASFLIYRISEVQSTQSPKRYFIEDLQNNPSNLDVYAEILKWQKDIRAQRIQLTQSVITNSLEQIAKVKIFLVV